jgi:hypothetical protein
LEHGLRRIGQSGQLYAAGKLLRRKPSRQSHREQKRFAENARA